MNVFDVLEFDPYHKLSISDREGIRLCAASWSR